MAIIYLGILTVTFFRFSKFFLNFSFKSKVVFCFVMFYFVVFCFFSPETQCLRSYKLLYCGKNIFFESRLYFKTSIHHIHSFWIIDFSGRFVLLFMFIFIYTFPSQGSFCVDIGLLFNIHLSYVSITELVILGYEHRDCWWLK